MVRHVLEMKVGAVYLHADMGSLWGDEYNSVLEKGLRRQAEEAFMRTAALIGVAASREVIVHAKT